MPRSMKKWYLFNTKAWTTEDTERRTEENKNRAKLFWFTPKSVRL